MGRSWVSYRPVPVSFDNIRAFYPGPYRHDTALAILSLNPPAQLELLA